MFIYIWISWEALPPSPNVALPPLPPPSCVGRVEKPWEKVGACPLFYCSLPYISQPRVAKLPSVPPIIWRRVLPFRDKFFLPFSHRFFLPCQTNIFHSFTMYIVHTYSLLLRLRHYCRDLDDEVAILLAVPFKLFHSIFSIFSMFKPFG